MQPPSDIIAHQKIVNDYIESIKPKLIAVSTKHHHALTEISNVVFHDSYISFMASGYCWGHFEEYFDVDYKDLI